MVQNAIQRLTPANKEAGCYTNLIFVNIALLIFLVNDGALWGRSFGRSPQGLQFNYRPWPLLFGVVMRPCVRSMVGAANQLLGPATPHKHRNLLGVERGIMRYVPSIGEQKLKLMRPGL